MSDPNYAILRIKRLKSKGDLDAATRHGRRQDTGTHFDPERTQFNEHYGACLNAGPVDWAVMVAAALERRGAVARRSAAVAAEFFVGASPEFFAPRPWEPYFNMERVRAFANAVLDAFYDRFGDMVVAARLDLDEGSPHMAICVVPIYAKVTKHKTQATVSYRKVFGGHDRLEARARLIELQDWFAEKMAPLGLVRGVSKSVTQREHLSHHQYAKRRRQEDEDRAKTLAEARDHADRVRLALEDIDARAARQELAETAAAEWKDTAARLLEEAKNLHAFLSQATSLIKKYDPQAPMAKVIEAKEPAMARAQAAIDRLEEAVEDLRQSPSVR